MFEANAALIIGVFAPSLGRGSPPSGELAAAD
jgi:hypothetical protein